MSGSLTPIRARTVIRGPFGQYGELTLLTYHVKALVQSWKDRETAVDQISRLKNPRARLVMDNQGVLHGKFRLHNIISSMKRPYYSEDLLSTFIRSSDHESIQELLSFKDNGALKDEQNVCLQKALTGTVGGVRPLANIGIFLHIAFWLHCEIGMHCWVGITWDVRVDMFTIPSLSNFRDKSVDQACKDLVDGQLLLVLFTKTVGSYDTMRFRVSTLEP